MPSRPFVRNAKEQNRRNTERVGASGFMQKFVRRKLKNSRHGGDGAAQFFAVADKQRQNELLHVQACFSHEPPQHR